MKQIHHPILRAAALLLCAVLLLSAFAACRKNASADTAQTTAPSVTDPTETPADGPSVTDVANYTVKDLTPEDERVDEVVVTCGALELTNHQFPIYFWMQYISVMNQYGYYLNIDETKPMSEQASIQDGMTWEQLFVQSAVDQFHTYAAIYAEAEKDGYQLPEEMETQLAESLQSIEDEAALRGYESSDAYLQASFGGSVLMSDYADYLRFFYTVMSYETDVYHAMDKSCTDADLDAFYEEHKQNYIDLSAGTKCIDVRHILIMPDDLEGDTDEDKQTAAKSLAEEILADYLKEPTEDRFAALAEEHSVDPGSASNGGLYQAVCEGDMVAEFNDWCFDEARKPGDTGIVQTQYGYHVMYFVGDGDLLRVTVREDYLNNRMNTWIGEAVEACDLKVDYTKIVLGEVDMSSDE